MSRVLRDGRDDAETRRSLEELILSGTLAVLLSTLCTTKLATVSLSYYRRRVVQQELTDPAFDWSGLTRKVWR